MALTTTGVAAQILSSIECYKKQIHPQTENDCKVALNRLIRAFGEAMKMPSRSSEEAQIYDGKIIKDHIVPIKVMMHKLLEKELSSTDKADHTYVMDYLKKNLVIVEITDEEDRNLRQNSLHDSMPKNWDHENIWARYDLIGIIVPKE